MIRWGVLILYCGLLLGCNSTQEHEIGVRLSTGKRPAVSSSHKLTLRTQDGRVLHIELPSQVDPKALKTLNMIMTNADIDYSEALAHQERQHIHSLNQRALQAGFFWLFCLAVLFCGTYILVTLLKRGGNA